MKFVNLPISKFAVMTCVQNKMFFVNFELQLKEFETMLSL